MCRESPIQCWVMLTIAIVTGIILGTIIALLWNFGLITAIHLIIPYAAADALLILALTTLMALSIAIIQPTCLAGIRLPGCLSRHVIVITLMAVIFLIFVQIFVGTTLTMAMKTVLSFIGGISFLVMITTFVSAVFSLARSR